MVQFTSKERRPLRCGPPLFDLASDVSPGPTGCSYGLDRDFAKHRDEGIYFDFLPHHWQPRGAVFRSLHATHRNCHHPPGLAEIKVRRRVASITFETHVDELFLRKCLVR
ncbi:hypothetical protein HYQ44_012126 [Verticillium longisporum]|nr:hypothetical protein HYQ44_012126 [Verticillium longisporum]